MKSRKFYSRAKPRPSLEPGQLVTVGAQTSGMPNQQHHPMQTTLKEPCKQCPFRRKAPEGWLGPWTVTDLLRQIAYGQFPCHMTIRNSDPTPEQIGRMKVCAGAAMFLNNQYKLARDPSLIEMQRRVKEINLAGHEQVFKTAQEFIKHHGEDEYGGGEHG